ncbi:MAG: hypothetical protein V7721_10675 [Porticoccaceae bacterium]
MALRCLLWFVGIQLAIASRLSGRLRRQLSRDLIFTVCAKDGSGRSYVFQNRRVSSHDGRSSQADCTLIFSSTGQGVGVLLAGNAVERIVDGLACRTIELEGDPTTVLWFYELVFGFLPWRKTPRRDLPDSYIAHNPNSKVAGRITRQPAVEALDPAWSAAVGQREKLVMWQVGQGVAVPNKPIDFKHVLDVPIGDGPITDSSLDAPANSSEKSA